ncbi:MAG TPA: alpha/beta fold hydrolase [Solirubrobacteraceae bacterium]|nr:alpha/beta fold hydrolase [Solirubrobacteraceae bacterium]
MATGQASAGALKTHEAYGPVGRSAWMDVDWREHLHWVQVDGRPVNVVDIGSGPVVVLLHGLAGCWQNWLETIPEFARDHRVIALDLPGFGASPMPAEPITMPGYARMLDELFVTLGVDSATLVGSSMGGFVAADFAIRYGAQVQRLCLTSPAGLSMEHMRNERNQSLRARIENVLFFGSGWLASKSDRIVRSERLRRALLMLVAAYPERLPSRLIAEQARGAGKPGFGDALDAMSSYPIRDRLGEVACPTLVVWGELDRLVPLRDAAEFEWLIPQARKIVYLDTGHLVMLERPARFNADLRAFLDEGPGAQTPWPSLRTVTT